MPGEKVIGLIAGAGRLPGVLAREAAGRGLRVVAVSVVDCAGAGDLPALRVARGEVPGVAAPASPAGDLAGCAEAFFAIPFTEWGRVVDTLKQNGARKVYLAGKLSRRILAMDLEEVRPDERFRRLLARAGGLGDDGLLSAFIEDLAAEGMTVGDQTEMLEGLLAQAGTLSRRPPSAREWEDIRFGRPLAQAIAELQIGQTVVVKAGVVLAVEAAAEGTDATILRGGALAGGSGAVVVKAAKPRHDLRFDLPVIGPETVEVLRAAGVSAIAVEAGRTLFLERERTLAAADGLGIAVEAF